MRLGLDAQEKDNSISSNGNYGSSAAARWTPFQ